MWTKEQRAKDAAENLERDKLESCMHCGEKIIPLVRGLGDKAVCTPCGVKRLGLIVFAVRAGCQAGQEFLRRGASDE